MGAPGPPPQSVASGEDGGPDDDRPVPPASDTAQGGGAGGGSTSAEESSTGELVVGPAFVEVAAEVGITHAPGPNNTVPNCLIDRVNPYAAGAYCLPERFAGGAAADDVDGDGFTDLLVTRAYGHDVLYRNRGDGTFEDITAEVGLDIDLASAGAAWGDVDGDGDSDLYVSTLGATRNYLFINHDGVFVEEAQARGAAVDDGLQHAGTSVAFGDYDLDGDLDLYVGEWRTEPLVDPRVPSHARLLRNMGGWFEDVTDAAGANVDITHILPGSGPAGTFVFSIAFSDIDRDDYPDLLLASDYGWIRLLWGSPSGVFTDGTIEGNIVGTVFAMGASLGDFDADGDLDWFVSDVVGPNFPGHHLYRYDGARSFTDVAVDVGAHDGGQSEWGWGAAFFDHDLDGDLDIVVANGWYGSGYIDDSMVVFTNDGAGNMTPDHEALGLYDVGQGRGVVTFDADNDGDLDLFVAHQAEAPRFFRNDTVSDGHWLRIRAPGRISNTAGIGAQITVDDGTHTRYAEIGATGSHYRGHGPREAHFGLGDAPSVDVRVYWPVTAAEVVLADVATDQILVVEEPG